MNNISHQINISLQIIPKGKEDTRYALVDDAITVIKESGLRYLVTPMETVIEGPYDAVMEVVKAAQEACLASGAEEVLTIVKLHVRNGKDVTFEEKTEKYT